MLAAGCTPKVEPTPPVPPPPVTSDALGLPPQVAPGAGLEVVHAERKFFEAPVWDPAGGKLYFDAYKKVDMLVRLDAPGTVTTMPATEGVGGTFLGRDGRLLAADCRRHRILSFRLGSDGLSDMQVLAADASWRQPNDLCQTLRGDIYFTDPDFNARRNGAVYHLSPAGQVRKAVAHLPCPNGIIGSPDGRTVYVSDTDRKEWWAFPVLRDGSLGRGKLFFKPRSTSSRGPDGMTVDEKGNVYLTGLGGVWVVTPAGRALGFVPVPEFASNVAFGGADGRTLFITCGRKVYGLRMRVRGAPLRSGPRRP